MRGLAGLARSLEGRTVAVLLLAVLAVHGGALALYRRSASAAADDAFATEIAHQLVLAREAVLRRPPEDRGTEAQAAIPAHKPATRRTLPMIAPLPSPELRRVYPGPGVCGTGPQRIAAVRRTD